MRAANVNSMRGVTNSAGVVGGNQRAEGTVSADVMPSSTNQGGGGIRPTVRPAFPHAAVCSSSQPLESLIAGPYLVFEIWLRVNVGVS